MLVPAWDFVADLWQHGQIAVMRGVEDGFSIARAAKQGYLTVSDNRGRIVAETRQQCGAVCDADGGRTGALVASAAVPRVAERSQRVDLHFRETKN